MRFIDDSESPWGDEVVFLVNGTALLDLVPSSSAGGWIGPPIKVLAMPSDHLMGGPDRWEDAHDPWYDDPAILACPCGQPGCNAVLIHIEIGDSVVSWSRIRHGHADQLVSDDIGPYTFDRTEYSLVVEAISKRAKPPNSPS